MSDIDWGLARAPNIYGALTQGMDQGRQNKRQDTYDAYQQELIAGERMDRQNQAADRARIDADRARAEQGRTATADALGRNDMSGARKAAIQAGDPRLLEAVSKLDEQTRADLKQRNQTQAAALSSLRGPDGKLLPDAAARWANMKQHFLSNGWKPEELDFDPLQPGVIDAELADAMTLDETLKLAETSRHNREMEDIGRDRAQSYDYGQRRPGRGGRGGDLGDYTDPKTGQTHSVMYLRGCPATRGASPRLRAAP
jgi:hypothetical protein